MTESDAILFAPLSMDSAVAWQDDPGSDEWTVEIESEYGHESFWEYLSRGDQLLALVDGRALALNVARVYPGRSRGCLVRFEGVALRG